MIWLCRKGIVSDETMSKYDLPVLPQKPKELSTKLIAYWLIIVMQFGCLHMYDLNLQGSHESKLKRLTHENFTASMHLLQLLQVTNDLVWLVTKDD